MRKHRVINGAIMIGMLLGALLLPTVGVFLIIPILAFLMCDEIFTMLATAGMTNFKKFGTGATVLLIVSTGALYLFRPTADPVATEAALLGLIVFAVLLRQCAATNDARPLVTIMATLFGILYVGFVFNFYTKLLLMWPGENDGRWVLLYLVMIVKVTDMAAYFTGCSWGRHKLIPRLSPGKTWEGCAGGVLGGCLTSVLIWWLLRGQIGPMALGIRDVIVLGVLLPVTGIVGDLIESMLKRAAGVKDSGTWIKGMGGVLDILDSLLFAGPVLYVYIKLFIER